MVKQEVTVTVILQYICNDSTYFLQMIELGSNNPIVMILSFWTDRSEQKVQTQIRLLLEEQSDQGLHCLPFHLHHLDSLLYGTAT